jgi:hypothetical protein
VIRILSVLLLLQLGTIVFLYWPQDRAVVDREALVPGLPAGAVERILITDSEGTTVTLARAGEGWTFNGSLPADQVKIDTLLASLLTSDAGLAIATSESAAKRFRVTDADFERRIVLAGADGDRGGDGSEETVFLGTSPSFRKIHARREGDASVFVVELNSYDAPTNAGAWLDRSLLAIRDVSGLELYGQRFELADDAWTRDDGEPADPEAIEQLLQALAGLRVSGISDETDEDAQAAGEKLRMTIVSGDETIRVTVLDNPESERFFVSSDRFDATFSTSAFDAERLIDAARSVGGIDTTPEDLGDLVEAPEQ